MSQSSSRTFLFLDEVGDQGIGKHSSDFYIITVAVTTRDGLKYLTPQLARLRYFLDATKEFKDHYKGRAVQNKTLDLLSYIADIEDFHAFSFYLNKHNFTGPYLHKTESESTHNPSRFRNFTIRIALEILYNNLPSHFNNPEMELVIDRFLTKPDEEINLRAYLNNNYNLPYFLHVTQVDSQYCDPIQFTDLLGTITKCGVFESDEKKAKAGLKNLSLFCIDDPDAPKEKDPDTL